MAYRDEAQRLAQEALRHMASDLAELADEIGTHPTTISQWRRGIRVPSKRNLRRLATAVRRRHARLGRLAKEMERHSE